MNYKPDIQEKILGIFTPVRCLSEQQLRQYAAGTLPAFERHLIQQHLVDCDLCSEAAETFRQKGYRPKFEDSLPGMREQIRKEYFPGLAEAAPSARKTRNLKKERRREKLLIYTWSVLLGAGCLGGILFLALHYKNNASAGGAAISNSAPPVVSGHRPDSIIAAASQRRLAAAQAPKNMVHHLPAPLADNKVTAPAGKTGEQKATAVTPFGKTGAAEEKKKPADKAKTLALRPAMKPKMIHDSSGNGLHKSPAGANLKNDTELGGNTAGVQEDHADSAIRIRQVVPGAGEAGVPQTDPDEVLYTSAKNYLAQGNIENAISRFKFLASDAGNKYYQQSRFQLALCYKARGKNGKARKLLREIIAGGGIMKAQAQAELESL